MSGKFAGSTAFRSALIVTGATYISYGLGLLVSMVVARTLGPQDYGHYAYLVFLSGVLTALYGNGLNLSAIRFVAEALGRANLDEARRVHFQLGRWFVVSLVAVTILFFVFYPLLKPTDWNRPLWIFAVAVVISAVTKAGYLFGSSVSKGYGHFDIDARTISLMSFANLFAALACAYLVAPIDAFLWCFVAVSAGHLIVTQLFMRQAGIAALPGAIDTSLRDRIRRHYVWTGIFLLVFMLSNKTIETLFLNALGKPETVGWFAISASMTRGGVELLSSGLNTVLLPMMSHALGSNDVARAHRILADAIRYFAFLGVALAGVGLLWAEPLIHLLYGPQYAPAVIGLQVMMVVGALTMPNSAISSLLMATDRMHTRVIICGVAVVVTFAAAAYFVPRFGFEGALAAHAIAQALIFAMAIAVVVWMYKVQLPYGDLLRTVAAAGVGAALAGCVLMFSTDIPAQLVAGAVYGFGCVLGSLLVGIWKKSDVEILSDLVGQRVILRDVVNWLQRFARAS